MPTPEELAYGESVRAIDMQARSLDELRTRTGVLLAAASVVASFLGAEALKTSAFEGLAGLALIAFGVVLVGCIAILWPRHEWRFALGARILIEDWTGENPCGDEAEMLKFLAQRLEANWHANKERINAMLVVFQVAACALGAEVIFWTLQLAEGR
ncbi:MAG: hypothetical protein JSS99_12890 [Actinobacteria bacterium]|nr:hypothetical protein [Actinomycetota bacterium]